MKKKVVPAAASAEVHEEKPAIDMEDVKVGAAADVDPSDENQRFSPAPLEGEPSTVDLLGADYAKDHAGRLPRRCAPRNDSENLACEDGSGGSDDVAPKEGESQGLTEAQVQVMALELFVQDLKGMDAVLTYQILDLLWSWKSVEELKQAKVLLDYLIRRLEE